jgi:hypothetical protein
VSVQCAEPVLILGFNRPHLMTVLIERLREVRPTRVYVAIDGSRANRPDERWSVQQCRELVASIDWTTNVRTRFGDRNLGCGLAVSSAIEWFLTSEERGIVLEDDVLPDPSFFPFCSDLLDTYVHDERVLTINGHNLAPPRVQGRPDLPYRFSTYTEMWGWALWRRSWENYRLDITGWQTALTPRQLWERCGRSTPGALFWAAMFDMVASGEIDTWDIQFVYSAMLNNQVMAVPNVNLTENIGFGPDATHYFQRPLVYQLPETMSFPIEHGPIEVDVGSDTWVRRHHFQAEMRVKQILERSSPTFQAYVGEIIDLQREHPKSFSE